MVIIKDTREKNGWDFSFYGYEQVSAGLKEGDYTLQGLEDLVIVERKATTGEISINLGTKWKQFEAELLRLSTYKYPYIICEFSLDDIDNFPRGSGIPKKQWRKLKMTGKFIRNRLLESAAEYGITLIFSCSKEKAEKKVIELFTEIYQNEKRR